MIRGEDGFQSTDDYSLSLRCTLPVLGQTSPPVSSPVRCENKPLGVADLTFALFWLTNFVDPFI